MKGRRWLAAVPVLAIIACVAWVTTALAQIKVLPRGVQLPIQVQISMRVLDISRLLETTGEVGAAVEYIQRWNDPSLRFERAVAGSDHLDFIGSEAEARLVGMWSPNVVIENMIGAIRGQAVALSIFETGDVVLIRRMEADFRVPVNMSSFPFDIQRLPFRFVVPRYAAREVVIASTERDRAESSIPDRLSITNWGPKTIDFRQDTYPGWSAEPFSRLTAVAVVERLSSRYLLRLFIPFVALMWVSICVLWAVVCQQH